MFRPVRAESEKAHARAQEAPWTIAQDRRSGSLWPGFSSRFGHQAALDSKASTHRRTHARTLEITE